MTEIIKMPPQDTEAEQALIGACLIDEAVIFEVQDIIAPDDFYRPAHRIIFATIRKMANENRPVDLLTLTEELKKGEQLDDAGGVAYLTTMMNFVPTSANAKYYAEIVKNKAVRRRIISETQRMQAAAYSDDCDTTEITAQCEQAIYAIAGTTERSTLRHIKDMVDAEMKSIEAASQGNGVMGLRTGYYKLDGLLGGLHRTDLIILAARPAMGKTSFATNIAVAVARNRNNVLVFSLEMGWEQMARRTLAGQARIDSNRLRRGDLTEEEYARLSHAVGKLSEIPLWVDDKTALTIADMRSRIRRLTITHGRIDLIVIDYIGKIRGSKVYQGNRVQEVSEVARGLKDMARDFDVPVLCLAQLNRNVEERDDKVPRLADLRESGEIEQEADVVMFLYREDYYHRNEKDYVPTNDALLTIAKHRNGPIGEIVLRFDGPTTTFEEQVTEEEYRQMSEEYRQMSSEDDRSNKPTAEDDDIAATVGELF